MIKSKTRRVFLHAGTHKTGSTSVQHMLRDAASNLAEFRTKVVYDYPGKDRRTTNCTSIAHAFVRPDLWTPTRIIRGRQHDFGSSEVIDYFTRQFDDVGVETFILSAEAFCYLRTRTERKLLERHLSKLECDVIPIVYFRNRADWRRSWDAQLTKMDSTRLFREQQPTRFTLLDDWYFDQKAITQFWRAINPNAVFIDYDKEVAERGSVIPAFLQLVGLPPSLNSERYFLNRSSGG